MDVHWLEQTERDVPAGNGWLSTGEARRLEELRFPKRRADWRLGRWTAKCAVTALLAKRYRLAEIEVRAAPAGAPEVFCANRPAAFAISLSHRGGIACCAVAPSATALGCDLESVEPHSRAFIADYFTSSEQGLIARVDAANQSLLVALLWSAKESTLKALRVGLRLDTRSVVVQDPALPSSPPSGRDHWRPLLVRDANGDFHGWWQSDGKLVRTVIATPPPNPPQALSLATPAAPRCAPLPRVHALSC